MRTINYDKEIARYGPKVLFPSCGTAERDFTTFHYRTATVAQSTLLNHSTRPALSCGLADSI